MNVDSLRFAVCIPSMFSPLQLATPCWMLFVDKTWIFPQGFEGFKKIWHCSYIAPFREICSEVLKTLVFPHLGKSLFGLATVDHYTSACQTKTATWLSFWIADTSCQVFRFQGLFFAGHNIFRSGSSSWNMKTPCSHLNDQQKMPDGFTKVFFVSSNHLLQPCLGINSASLSQGKLPSCHTKFPDFFYHNLPQCMIAADFSPQFLWPRRAPLQAQFSNAPLLNTQPFQQQWGVPRTRVSREGWNEDSWEKAENSQKMWPFPCFLGPFIVKSSFGMYESSMYDELRGELLEFSKSPAFHVFFCRIFVVGTPENQRHQDSDWNQPKNLRVFLDASLGVN